MDFALNDIQQMLQDSAAKFIQSDYGFEKRQHFVGSELGFNPKNWSLFADLGWLALPFSESYGGLEGSIIDLMVLQTELGKGLITEPYFANVILAGNVIQRHGSEEQKMDLLGSLIAGELKLALAAQETASLSELTNISTKAEKQRSSYQLNGFKPVVLGAVSANKIIVLARTSGEFGNSEGLSLLLVNPDQQGVSLNKYVTNDGNQAADITFKDVCIPFSEVVGIADTAFEAVRKVYNDAIVAISAEAVGVMEKLLSATVEYCKVRKQFDQPIGNFQVLQHRMADMFMECEQAKSMLYYAAIAVDSDDNADKAVSLLKIKIGAAGTAVGQSAVQLHGGMGVSDELDVGHYFKRISMINVLFGSYDDHLNQLVKQYQT
ncbi:MAG: acyl-CoA dehydrogenase family protein [Kangiellaceae bacterium]|nr:acyl-CoA dehydrogenase family protein [Kangiellaceae bacterium]